MRPPAPLRITRALAITALITSLAAAAHTGAGGNLPSPTVLLALFLLVLLPVTGLTGRRLGLPALAGLMGAGQLFLHEAFTALTPAQSCAPARPAAWGHHTTFTWAGCTDDAVAGPESWPALLMPVVHLAASAAATLVLAKSEAALWAAAAWLRPLTDVPVLPVFPVRRTVPIQATGTIPATHRPARAHRLRGPPLTPAPAARHA